jgi:hypothetical protein
VLDRPDWCAAVHAEPDVDGAFPAWFGDNLAGPLRLRAFADF